MERLIEPELMQDKEQVKAYSEADFSLSDGSMIKELETYISSFGISLCQESLIIDLGCGPGNITERLALSWPSSTVIGIDGSLEMLKAAEKRKDNLKFKKQFGEVSYLHHQLAFLEESNFLDPADVLVSNSFLHHIHDPSQFWNVIKNLGKEGCLVFNRDLRRPSTNEEALLLVNKYQPDAPTILIKDYLASLHAAFTVNEVQQQIKEAGLYQLKVFEVGDRYLDVVGVL